MEKTDIVSILSGGIKELMDHKEICHEKHTYRDEWAKQFLDLVLDSNEEELDWMHYAFFKIHCAHLEIQEHTI